MGYGFVSHYPPKAGSSGDVELGSAEAQLGVEVPELASSGGKHVFYNGRGRLRTPHLVCAGCNTTVCRPRRWRRRCVGVVGSVINVR